ncbi:MAG: DUF5107 domain-containing protein [Clostridia bacterium]|nr:DUF5107 domain-containing protein [Clostridia bacterium]
MVLAEEKRILIDTYPEAKQEDLPMFAENRVHQRTSGNPYPNKVVLEAQRDVREKREYTLLTLENEFIEIGILPELGGKIWYANDKKNGYGFFYKNNVIKPALIGVLGSWTSGGLEFNWPFHHRASTFMPVDYYIENGDGYATVWLSEHDPINRMKGMVGISLRDGECIFETKVKVDNTTAHRHSFLWWENAAVPVDESYEIFFPEDVNYVRFHYKRSVTTYPIANNDRFGAFNGIYYNGDTDISKHKSTRDATSYFSAESEYDYFGGYNRGKAAGVVHIADHHISPGKKMFTWAYNQLSKTWEKALTDTDGQYAELMAGCYSDNQPDLTWLQPYETKTFSQKWFPIHDKGIPAFANEFGAVYIDECGNISLQATGAISGAVVTVMDGERVVFNKTVDIPCYEITELCKTDIHPGVSINIKVGVVTYIDYEIKAKSDREIPEPRRELPYFKGVKTAEELYREALHIEQYRSPEYSAEMCYLEALKRDPEFAPALTALAELYLKNNNAALALEYINKAEKSLSRFNIRHESGKAYYLKGLCLLSLAKIDEGYNYLFKAAWCYDYKAAAMQHIGLIDIRRGDYLRAVEHLEESLCGNSRAVVAQSFLGYAKYLGGDKDGADRVWNCALNKDKINLFTRAFVAITTGDYKTFCDFVHTDISQVCLDITEYLYEAGLHSEIKALLLGVSNYRSLSSMPRFVLAMLDNTDAPKSEVGIAFPSRMFEKHVLEKLLCADPCNNYARYLYACLLYGKGMYDEGIAEFERVCESEDNYRALRCLSMGYYSHKNDKVKALTLMKRAAELAPRDEKQITFECAHLMAKVGEPPEAIEAFIKSRDMNRDDITVELARAYNHEGKPRLALDLLLGRRFVACEGGEHYIADEYMFAHYLLGKDAYLNGDYEAALEIFRSAQVLPESLGSGLWNAVKRAPYKYFEAKCLEKLGRADEAKDIYLWFGTFNFDFFTDMYLYTFAYYAARGLEALGKADEARALVRSRYDAWCAAAKEETLGYFGTTPFFIGYIDEAKSARELHYSYPLYLFSSFLGIDAEGYKKVLDADGFGLYIEDFTV